MLFGDQEPSGRLPQTFPKALKDMPVFTGDPTTYPGVAGHVRYDEGIFVGYRHFDTRNVEPLFPFGFGLGYTTFAWTDAKASSDVIGAEGVLVTVRVENTGARAGSEVVQLYVRPRAAKVERRTRSSGPLPRSSSRRAKGLR